MHHFFNALQPLSSPFVSFEVYYVNSKHAFIRNIKIFLKDVASVFNR